MELENEKTETGQNPAISVNTSDGVDSITDDVIAETPEVSEAAVSAHKAEQAKIAETANKVDSAGIVFNPDIHALGPDGQPSLTKTGRFAKRRGRKAGGAAPQSYIKRPGKDSKAIAVVPGELTEHDLQRARATGVGLANMIFATGQALGGDEWAPRKTAELDERKMLESAFADYCVASGKTDISPGWALCFALSAYAVPRFTSGPKTQSRVKALGAKIAGWWYSRKGKKKGVSHGSQSDTRNDGKRENDASKENR